MPASSTNDDGGGGAGVIDQHEGLDHVAVKVNKYDGEVKLDEA